MTELYQDIDAGIAYQCKTLEDRGVPLDLSELNLRVFRKNQELTRLKEGVNRKFGFVPTFLDDKTWKRVFLAVVGQNIPVSPISSKVSLSRRTVEEYKHYCPELVDLYEGLKIERLLSQMEKVAGAKVSDQDKVTIRPRYKIDPASGQVFLRDPNLRTWRADLKATIHAPDSRFLLLGYDALDLTVLQDFAQDPVLGFDLESDDPYHTMGCRFWETDSPTREQVFIARMAFTLFCNGVKSDRFWTSINTTYSDQCALTSADASSLYDKFVKHYTVSCEYFDKVTRMAVSPRSAFGRWGVGRDSRCYAMFATVVDITKLGFLAVLEDSRLEKLGVTPLALISGKMLLMMPHDGDASQVGGYLTGDFRGAYTKYPLRPRITTGQSWGECDLDGNLPDESE